MRESASPEQLRSDEEIIGACASSPGACDELYRRFFPKAVEIGRSITRDDERGRELAQETFARLVEGDIAKYQLQEKGTFLHWLTTVMRNRYVSALRKSKREILIDVVPSDGELVATARTPEEIAAGHELRDRINEALTQNGATPEQREALILHEVGGLSYQEIADRQGVAVGTVMSRIFRARKKAQAVLGSLYEEIKRAA